MPDMLAKAAEAVREWLGRQYCNVYCTYRDPGRCTRATSECIGRCLWVTASDAARAVLEAVGYGEAVALVEELRQWVHSECASIMLYGPEDCQHCAYRKACKLPSLAERIKAALARAGKEA